MRPNEPFDALLYRYRGLLFSLCRHYVGKGLEVDDMLQEASIALWKASDKLFSLPSIQQAALVWKIARNAIIDSLRRTPQTDPLPDDYDTTSEDKTLINELHEQIALLDEPDRTIVRMQLEGYSYEEIGNAVNMTEKNVSVRLIRIKEKLRKKMIL